jgi:hypothetical protein
LQVRFAHRKQNFCMLGGWCLCIGGCDPSLRNVHCVVLGTSNPPGSLNCIMNEVGRSNDRSLIHGSSAIFTRVGWSLSGGRLSHYLLCCFLGSF